MSLTQTEVKASDYIETGKTTATDPSAIERKALKKLINRNSTAYTLWVLTLKHKVPLMALGNIVLVLNWAFPEWTELVKSLIG